VSCDADLATATYGLIFRCDGVATFLPARLCFRPFPLKPQYRVDLGPTILGAASIDDNTVMTISPLPKICPQRTRSMDLMRASALAAGRGWILVTGSFRIVGDTPGQFEPPQKSPKIEASRFRQYIGQEFI